MKVNGGNVRGDDGGDSFTLNGWSLVPSRSLEKEHSKACANPWRTISLIDGLGYAFTCGLLLEP